MTPRHPPRLEDWPFITTHNPSPSSNTRLRQVALVAQDLDLARTLLTKCIGTEVVYEDPDVARWGLRNFIIAIGGDFIEVVSPTEAGTSAGRLLEKRGDGGYMIIMQCENAAAQRDLVTQRGLAKVIFTQEQHGNICVQYHPSGIAGGIMPELDSMAPTPVDPSPLRARFSAWHACGADADAYRHIMARQAYLHLIGVVLRLAPGDTAVERAAQQWSNLFAIPVNENTLSLTNGRIAFVQGEAGEKAGIVSISIAVERKEKFDAILDFASKNGLCGDGWINMVGIKWYFLLSEAETGLHKL